MDLEETLGSLCLVSTILCTFDHQMHRYSVKSVVASRSFLNFVGIPIGDRAQANKLLCGWPVFENRKQSAK